MKIYFIIILLFILIIYYKNKIIKENFKINNFIKEIYVINLDKDKNRLKMISKQINKCNLNLKRFPAVNGNLINLHQYDYIFGKNSVLSNSQKGCSLSHLKLWKKLNYGNPNDTILILEDDAIIPNNFISQLKKYIGQIKDNWEMILLGGNNFKGYYYSDNIIKPIYYKEGNWGTYAYLIKRNTVKKILQISKNIDTTIDNHLNKNFYQNNSVFFCVPQIVKHNFNYYSNIEKTKRTKDTNYKTNTKIL